MKKWINKLLISSLLPGMVIAAPIPEIDCLIEPNMSIELSSAVSGVLDTILVDRSDSVKKGQILATLKADVMRVRVKTSKENLKLSIIEQRRAVDLYKENVITLSEKEQSDHERVLYEFELKQAEANLEQRIIRSPINAVIADRYLMPGEHIEDNPVLKLVQLNPLRIEVVSPVENFGRIKLGMQARISTEFGLNKELIGKVVVVDKVIDAASGTFGVRLELDNNDYSVPGGLKCKVAFLENMPIVESAKHHKTKPTTDTEIMSSKDSVFPVLANADDALMCTSIGPYKKQAKLNELVDLLDPLILQSKYRIEPKKNVTYMVFSEVFETYTQAKAAKLDMKTNGVSDSFMMNKGNGFWLALGVYIPRTVAQKRVDSLQNKGFKAQIVQSKPKARAYWADVVYASESVEALKNTVPKSSRSTCNEGIKLSLVSKM